MRTRTALARYGAAGTRVAEGIRALSETGNELRATSDALLRDLADLQALEHPDSPEADVAERRIDQLRREYRRAHEAARNRTGEGPGAR